MARISPDVSRLRPGEGKMCDSQAYDASRTGKLPNWYQIPPGDNLPHLKLGLVSPRVGFGLFAARKIREGEVILHEAPFMTSFHEEVSRHRHVVPSGPSDDKLAASRHQIHAFTAATARTSPHCQAFMYAYPRLMIDLHEWPDVFPYHEPVENGFAPIWGTAVEGQGVWGGTSMSLETYQEYIEQMKRRKMKPRNGTALSPHERDALIRGYICGYAFKAEQMSDTQRYRCNMYMVCGLINHCCPGARTLEEPNPKKTGPNCEFQIGPGRLTKWVVPGHVMVRSRRDIEMGEEVTISYGKRQENIGFACECETCRGRKGWWRRLIL